ncbi:hypothetical protein BJ165DRAFT_625555 [Panaeolus papilionaceus]|nr:hypothetical protein BJ165DRAFT_625555 [Panaeolus papilionaceus]
MQTLHFFPPRDAGSLTLNLTFSTACRLPTSHLPLQGGITIPNGRPCPAQLPTTTSPTPIIKPRVIVVILSSSPHHTLSRPPPTRCPIPPTTSHGPSRRSPNTSPSLTTPLITSNPTLCKPTPGFLPPRTTTRATHRAIINCCLISVSFLLSFVILLSPLVLCGP